MSGSRRTYDTDQLVIRQVTALDPNNAARPANTVLTADGAGGTYWAIPCTLGALPAFTAVTANGIPILADRSTNTLTLTTANGIDLNINSTTKSITFFGKSFGEFDISGGNTLTAYSNQIATPTVKFVGCNGVTISADPLTNTLFFQGQQPAISSGLFGYSQINVISNASTLTNDSIINSNSQHLTATSPSTVLKMIGVGDILLATNTTSNAVFISISTFTSQGWADLSGVAHSTFEQVLSTVSSLYSDNTEISTVASAILASQSNMSVGIQQKFAYEATYTMDNYVNYFIFNGFSNSTISNVNRLDAKIDNVYLSTISSINGNVRTSSLTVTNTFNMVTSPNSTIQPLTISSGYWFLSGTLMSTIGIGSNQFNSTITGLVNVINSFIDPNELTSTVVGLASGSFISTTGVLSTVYGLGTTGYVSSTQLASTTQNIVASNLPSTVAGLRDYVGSFGALSTPVLFSTVGGLTSGLASTTRGLGTAGYVSTFTNVSSLIVSSIGINNNQPTWQLDVNGSIRVQGATIVDSIQEVYTTVNNPTGTYTFNWNTTSIYNITGMTANFTANFTNVPQNTSNVYVMTLMLQQSGSPFFANAVQVNGSATTIKWPNASIPSPTASRVEIESFTMFYTGSAWNVMGQLTSFG